MRIATPRSFGRKRHLLAFDIHAGIKSLAPDIALDRITLPSESNFTRMTTAPATWDNRASLGYGSSTKSATLISPFSIVCSNSRAVLGSTTAEASTATMKIGKSVAVRILIEAPQSAVYNSCQQPRRLLSRLCGYQNRAGIPPPYLMGGLMDQNCG